MQRISPRAQSERRGKASFRDIESEQSRRAGLCGPADLGWLRSRAGGIDQHPCPLHLHPGRGDPDAYDYAVALADRLAASNLIPDACRSDPYPACRLPDVEAPAECHPRQLPGGPVRLLSAAMVPGRQPARDDRGADLFPFDPHVARTDA